MNKWEEEVIKKLENLDEVPNRNPLKVQSHKQNFMKNAQMIKSDLIVSSPRQSRRNQLFHKKELFTMKVISIFAILGLLFGGGVTAVAAQDSLPGDVLYPVKTLVEDIELGLATDPETQFKLSLDQLNTRFEEIQLLLDGGEMPPEPHFYDMYLSVEETMQFALQSGDTKGNLFMLQETLRTQSRFAGETSGEPFMQMLQKGLQYQEAMIDAGIDEPENLASELEFMFQYKQQMGKEDGEEVWQNLYQYQEQSQNAGDDQNFQWMFMRSEINDLEESPQNGHSDESGAQNSFNDQPNGGNQGDNDNGSNGGQGGNGSGGKK